MFVLHFLELLLKKKEKMQPTQLLTRKHQSWQFYTNVFCNVCVPGGKEGGTKLLVGQPGQKIRLVELLFFLLRFLQSKAVNT